MTSRNSPRSNEWQVVHENWMPSAAENESTDSECSESAVVVTAPTASQEDSNVDEDIVDQNDIVVHGGIRSTNSNSRNLTTPQGSDAISREWLDEQVTRPSQQELLMGLPAVNYTLTPPPPPSPDLDHGHLEPWMEIPRRTSPMSSGSLSGLESHLSQDEIERWVRSCRRYAVLAYNNNSDHLSTPTTTTSPSSPSSAEGQQAIQNQQDAQCGQGNQHPMHRQDIQDLYTIEDDEGETDDEEYEKIERYNGNEEDARDRQ